MLLGIFDSGFGGITVLNQVLKRHGNVPVLYLADTARVPYGNKTTLEIRSIAREVVSWLESQNISALLVACNTTNSLALDLVKKISSVPVFTLINSASQMIREKRVGVLATQATISSNAYKETIHFYYPETFIVQQSCPELVPLIESGHLNSTQLRKVAMNYLAPLIKQEVDSIIMGCSHYPLIEPVLKQLLPSHVRLIDPAIGISRKLDSILGPPKSATSSSISLSNTRIVSTSDPEKFAYQARSWIDNVPEIKRISLLTKTCLF